MILTVTLNPAVDKVLEVPAFAVGAHARAAVKSLLPAGKGVNVARGIARLGGEARATGLIGRNEQRMFAESLAEEGVEAEFWPVAGLTRTNTTILDPDAHTTTHLRERGFRVGAEDVAAIGTLLERRLSEWPGATVVFAGSLPDGLSSDAFAGLVRSCAGRGAEVVVDTNGPALRAAVESRAVSTVKPNLEELAECVGRPVQRRDALDAARELLGCVTTVLLTLGEEGAYLVTRAGATGRRCPLGPGELGNTVGCGDAFLAGWLRGRQISSGPCEALSWAVAAGAASAMSETTVGYTLADVETLLRRCTDTGKAVWTQITADDGG
jgi:1-phosphofructokinase